MMLIGQLSCWPFLNKVVSTSQSIVEESRYWGKPRVGHHHDGISVSCEEIVTRGIIILSKKRVGYGDAWRRD